MISLEICFINCKEIHTIMGNMNIAKYSNEVLNLKVKKNRSIENKTLEQKQKKGKDCVQGTLLL